MVRRAPGNGGLISTELTVVIIRFVVLYLSEFPRVLTYVNEHNPRSREQLASVYKELKCICNVYVKLALKSRLKSIPFGLNKVDPVILLFSP